MYKYYKLYKPYGYLAQFTEDHEGQKTLAELMPEIPSDVYPLGRLDKDSEGLLLLTNNRSVTQSVLHPKNAHNRTYHVQVEGTIDPEQIPQLTQSIDFRAKKKSYTARFQSVHILDPFPYKERNPPIRVRKSIPDTALSVSLTEGKNRQVRKMLAAFGYPVLRLIRYSIENLSIHDLMEGKSKEIEEKAFMDALGL
jgi:23S rRNA pseudouridine2457 synthase